LEKDINPKIHKNWGPKIGLLGNNKKLKAFGRFWKGLASNAFPGQELLTKRVPGKKETFLLVSFLKERVNLKNFKPDGLFDEEMGT